VNPAPAAHWDCPPKTVLVAVDFGEASARAVAIAGVVASAFDARLLALHAERFEPPPYFTMEQVVRLEAERRIAQGAAIEHLRQFVRNVSTCPVEPSVADEFAVEAILEAGARADLIVVGTHGRRGPGRWWLGSVAERVVRAAPVPVLVTRAASGAPRGVFERIVLLHDGKDSEPSLRTCAGRLASIAGGAVVEAESATQCDPDVIQRASLVVAAWNDPSPWGIQDPVAKVLGACERPVLFVPRHAA
jgi:nucleotide-binding universal stress UspA family protein